MVDKERKPTRVKSQNIIIAGREFLTVDNFAAQINKPPDLVRAWINRTQNPLPTFRPPSADPNRVGQTQYIIVDRALDWLLSFEQIKNPPRKPPTAKVVAHRQSVGRRIGLARHRA